MVEESERIAFQIFQVKCPHGVLKECVNKYHREWQREHQQKSKPKPKSTEDCPLLEKCIVFGIDCRDRDYRMCDFYNNLLREK